jgi:hypothetical protein
MVRFPATAIGKGLELDARPSNQIKLVMKAKENGELCKISIRREEFTLCV